MEESRKDQLIQDYLEGSLTAEAKLDFEKELEENPALAAEIQDLQEVELGLHGIGVEKLKETISIWEKEYASTHQRETKVIQFRPYYAIAATIALLVAAAAGYLFWPNKLGSEVLYAQNFSPYEDMILSRGEEESDKVLLVNGMEAYNKGQFADAAEALSHYLLQENSEDGAALYAGIAQMEIGNFADAEASFERAKLAPKFAQQAEWYEALMYLKSNQLSEAQKALEIITQNPQHYQSGNAKVLLEELD